MNGVLPMQYVYMCVCVSVCVINHMATETPVLDTLNSSLIFTIFHW